MAMEEETPVINDEVADLIDYKYSTDERIDASGIEVTVEGGKVVLEGSVPTQEEKEMAESLLDDIEGIETVENFLQVILSDYTEPLAWPGVDTDEEEFEGVEVTEPDEKLVTEDVQEAIEEGKSYVPPNEPMFPDERGHAAELRREHVAEEEAE